MEKRGCTKLGGVKYNGKTDAYVKCYLDSLKAISNLLEESIYVIDFQHRCFRFVSDKGCFLCGRSSEEVLQSGYNFYTEAVLPDDYPLAVKIHQAVMHYFSHLDTPIYDLDYIIFNFRMCHNRGRLMVDHRITPLIVNNQVQMAICIVSPSMSQTSGNLFACYQDVCYQYSFISHRWKQELKIELSTREKNILELFKAGVTRNDIADMLCISPDTLRNSLSSIYNKLNVHSMMQAVNFATIHRLISFSDQHFNKEEPKALLVKSIRRLITPDMMMRIQERLDNNESIRSIAKQEDISEGAIRYNINNGKLKNA